MIKHLRISPLAVTESKDKFRVILDLSFGSGGSGKGRLGVNGDTCFEKALVCEIGGVMPNNVMRRVCALRQDVGSEVPIYGAKMDVKDAFRRIHIEWDKAPNFRIHARRLYSDRFSLGLRVA